MARREDITTGDGELDGLSGRCELWPVGTCAADDDQTVPAGSHVFSAASLREMDRLAVDEFGMPTVLLMENAGTCLAAHAKCLLAFSPSSSARAFRVLIVAGKGNNAGDGFAMARHLSNAGWRVAIVLAAAPDSYQGDARLHLTICERMRLPIVTARQGGAADAIERAARALVESDAPNQAGGPPQVDLIVDAILGTGLTGPVRGVAGELIQGINAARNQNSDIGPRVLAVDVPSGMDADTGSPAAPESPVVRADLTVSLVGLKPGYLTLGAQEYLGRVVVGDIGMPAALLSRFAQRPAACKRPGDEADRTKPAPRAYRRGE
ncbi:MAG: NAD(P)H-hydrate epimerase [Phycisphaerales bacterium]